MTANQTKDLKLLVVDDDQSIRWLIRTLLKNKFKIDCEEAKDGQEALALLDKPAKNDFDLIISDYDMPNFTGGQLFQVLQAKGSEIPFVFCTLRELGELKESRDFVLTGYINKLNLKNGLVSFLESFLHGKSLRFAGDSSKYVEIPFSILDSITFLPVDLFLKLSERKYIRVLRAEDAFTESDSEKYESKGLNSAYILSRDSDLFFTKFLSEVLGIKEVQSILEHPEQLIEKSQIITNEEVREGIEKVVETLELAKTKKLTQEYLHNVTERSLEIAHKASQAFGINPEVQSLIKASVGLALIDIAQIPTLGDLFRSVHTNKVSYIPSHSLQVAEVACMIATQMSWESDLTRYKLSLAAFLHDLTLADHGLAQITDLSNDSVASYCNQERTHEQVIDMIRLHPIKAAEAARFFNKIPPDVDRIIIQHHEMANGAGFPRGLHAIQVDPLSCVFIIAHDAVAYFRKHSAMDFELQDFIVEYETLYEKGGYFKKILAELKKLTAKTYDNVG